MLKAVLCLAWLPWACTGTSGCSLLGCLREGQPVDHSSLRAACPVTCQCPRNHQRRMSGAHWELVGGDYWHLKLTCFSECYVILLKLRLEFYPC